MENNKYEDMYKKLSHINESANEAIEVLQRKNRELLVEISVLNDKLVNAQRALDINKEIMRNTIISSNLMKDEFVAEINKLKNKIIELGG